MTTRRIVVKATGIAVILAIAIAAIILWPMLVVALLPSSMAWGASFLGGMVIGYSAVIAGFIWIVR